MGCSGKNPVLTCTKDFLRVAIIQTSKQGFWACFSSAFFWFWLWLSLLFLSHTWWCSRFTPDSVLRAHNGQDWVLGIEPGLARFKANVLPALLFLLSLDFAVIQIPMSFIWFAMKVYTPLVILLFLFTVCKLSVFRLISNPPKNTHILWLLQLQFGSESFHSAEWGSSSVPAYLCMNTVPSQFLTHLPLIVAVFPQTEPLLFHPTPCSGLSLVPHQ